ncbi:MAG: serine hydrolase [Anaerolineae bacterium]|nr:serine hydrolase [Anaerolineae bacterium]
MFKRVISLPRLVQRYLLACVVIALVSLLPGAAQASGGLPSALFDPNSVGWASVRNLTSSDFSADFEDRKDDGYMVTDIEVVEMEGVQRVSAVWKKNTDRRGWHSHRNLSDAEFHTKWTTYREQGYRLIDQEAYVLDGDRYYAGVWVENREGLNWGSYRNATSDEFHDKYLEYKNAGYIPIDVEAYPMAGEIRYSAVWVKNAEDLDWVLLRNMTSDEYHDRFEQYKGRYRVHQVMSYRRNGVQNYAAIWIENKNGRGWKALRDMTAQSYGDNWARYNDAGYRLTEFEVYETANGWRYAGVWRQNSERPSWALRNEVDAYLEGQMQQYKIPGMSVVIAQDGEIKYMRGFGYADVNDEKIATSKTVYRLASVSKAVAGVITMRLVEKGEFTLGTKTRALVPSLPAQHTHTLRQLVSNRAGVGHYDENGSSNAQYNTALVATVFFRNNPLVCAPGTCYYYSTHGYTLLGAAMEAATGKNIGQIVRDEITTPLNLPTLRPENRSVPDPNRAAVYKSDTTAQDEVSADNISWKVLGGGLESSAYDLARFGMKLAGGTVLSNTSRTTLWTKPDNLKNYALGWDTATDYVGKGGDQLGSDSYIRIYPDEKIVVAVLTNRNKPHSAPTMGAYVGNLVFDAATKRAKAEAKPVAVETAEALELHDEVVGLTGK